MASSSFWVASRLLAEASSSFEVFRSLRAACSWELRRCTKKRAPSNSSANMLSNSHDSQSSEEVIKFENIEISLQKYELKLKGKSVDIPPKELELLYFLASNYNRVFTRDQLLDKVWGFDYLGDSRTVDVHVKRLREKLEGVSDKWILKTVWGVGYKFEILQ